MTPAAAQTDTGQIAGIVTDNSKARLPGVTVSVINDATQATRTATTDTDGAWVITNLRPGNYTITAELEGFKKVRQSGFTLYADGRLTANLSLDVGGVTETVEVAAVVGETVNKTSGEIARTIDRGQVQDLALNGRNYLQLTNLIPGAVTLNDDSLDLSTSLSTTGQAINGNRGESNSLLVDGGTNLDSGSNGSQMNNVGLDFIQEVKIETSNFSAEYGRQSGAAINVITRSGTNRFTGSAFEFLRNDALDAANFFSPVDASGKKVKQKLKFNDYGGAVGGPILKDKAFFFVGQEYKYIRRQTNPTQLSVPSMAELNGDFSLRLAGTDKIPGTADDTILKDPTTGQPFPGNVIPASRITPDGRAIANTYLRMIQEAAGYNNAPVGNNATFQQDNPFDYREDILRLDYRVNDAQSVYVRYLHDKYDLIDPFGTFAAGGGLPTTPTNRLRPGTSYQVNHTWIVSPTLVNEVKVNASWNAQRIPPVGDTWQRASYGYQFPELFAPDPRFDGVGMPNVQVTGLARFQGPSFALLSPTTDIFVQESATWIHNDHSLKAGFKYTRDRKDQNGRTNYLGDMTFSTSGNPNSSGNAFADALLGNFRTYNEASSDPLGFFRFNQYEAFASDNWRVKPNLSLELGVRYQFAPPIYTQGNNVVNFDPSRYDPTKAVVMNPNGTIVPNSGYRFNGLIRAGDGVPDDQTGRVPIVAGADYAAIPTGAPRGLSDGQHLFMPRLSAAWSLNNKTVVRTGFGTFYDRPQGNIIYSSLNLPPFTQIVQYENGNLANPSGGTAAALAPLADISTIDPNLKTAFTMNYSVSVQRELGSGYFFEVAYVGNKGRDLLWFPDINRPNFADLTAAFSVPTAQRPSTNYLRPYKGYSQIQQRRSEATSNYNGLQTYLTKRRGDISFTVSYTLSKVLTSASGFGDNPVENDLNYAYGEASYDRRHVFVATYTYREPLFRDRGGILGGVLGNWEISGITRVQSGPYLTVTGSTSVGTRRADYLGGTILLPADQRGPNAWFNTAAFAASPEGRFGTATVGQILGPGRYAWDMSLRKKFPIAGNTKLGVQADVFNLFNRVNFNSPNVVTSDAAYGKISSAGPPRQIQLGIRFEF